MVKRFRRLRGYEGTKTSSDLMVGKVDDSDQKNDSIDTFGTYTNGPKSIASAYLSCF